MKYILDTNICIYIINRKPENVLKRLVKIKPGLITISSITIAELYFGIEKSSRLNENIVLLEKFLTPFIILDYNKNDALYYGKIRNNLERKGKMIGANDLLIASQALSRDLILVTNNGKEFNRIPELIIENWISK